MIKKIYSLRKDYHESCGPSETITLGVSVNGADFILGTFYFGPGMDKNTQREYEKADVATNKIVAMYSAIQGALAIEDLWMPSSDVSKEYEHEARALSTMRTMFRNCLDIR